MSMAKHRRRKLLALRREAWSAGDDASEDLRRSIAKIEKDEGIAPVARTTISNRMQLIRRAMKFAAQATHDVPQIVGLSMPPSSRTPSRTAAISAARRRQKVPA